jgi:hypothetical protein
MKKSSFSFGGVKPSAPKRAAPQPANVFDEGMDSSAKSSTSKLPNEAEEEIDPLDAFMNGIEATKSKASKPKVCFEGFLSTTCFASHHVIYLSGRTFRRR